LRHDVRQLSAQLDRMEAALGDRQRGARVDRRVED